MLSVTETYLLRHQTVIADVEKIIFLFTCPAPDTGCVVIFNGVSSNLFIIWICNDCL